MVYENVLSVSFIYAMGVYRGRNADPQELITDSINFYQQTPADPTLGDLMAHWKAKMFIIEFKGTQKEVRTEIAKESKTKILQTLIKDTELIRLSTRGHFIGYGKYEKVNDKSVADLLFQPYISLLLSSTGESDRFNEFMEKLSNEKDFGWTREEMITYTDFLKEHVSTDMADSSRESSGGRRARISEGLITVVGPESKVLTLHFRTQAELYWLLDQKLSLSTLLARQQGQNQIITRTIEKKQDQNISRGMDGP